ncbi:hypothetical protein JKY79_01370 [Candidatus Babeliales bacterium]|nr:hypothetical protein [Candidatus Babeliales bacterium]
MKYLGFISTIVETYLSYNRQKRLYMIMATAGIYLFFLGGIVWYVSDSADIIIQNIRQVHRLKKKMLH